MLEVIEEGNLCSQREASAHPYLSGKETLEDDAVQVSLLTHGVERACQPLLFWDPGRGGALE